MLRKLISLVLVLPLFTQAQQTTEYPNDYLSPEFHAGRRAAYREMMPKNSVAFFFASQVRVRNNDVDYTYAQSKNFYYLTGLEEPNSLLILFKEPVTINDKTGTEFLFVQPRNAQQEMWTGKIFGVDGVKERFRFENVFTHDKFTATTVDLSRYDSVFTLFRGEDIVSKFKRVPDPLSRMALITDSLIVTHKKPISNNTRVFISKLRGIKQPEEITLMEKVVNMSVLGHNEVMKAVQPGMTEYQAQAVMEYMFKKNGSEYVGYPSINGSSGNSCILHYVTNQRLMKNGDLLLSDCAAEYHGYSADVTRTVPINGKFSPEQKIIYELVLEGQDSAFEKCKPGIPFTEVDAAARRVINRGLVNLGIIANESQGRTYFPHGTSHHLGLDVHDPGSRGPLEEGALFTVEPGIYIPPNSKCDPKWWNIGVRIEDDILITKTGYRNLSAGSPRTVAEVEKMMKQKTVF
jgi:Xaa-Pro aminopeptidase